MGHTRAYELKLLDPAEQVIRGFSARENGEPRLLRRLLVAAAASRLGGVPLSRLVPLLQGQWTDKAQSEAWSASQRLISALDNLPIPPPLAISSLMRSELDGVTRRRSGSYITDFRLSILAMRRLAGRLQPGARVLDPAVGTGSFLVAFALEAARLWKKPVDSVVSSCLFGVDLSAEAVDGVVGALAATGSSIKSLRLMRSHLKVADSLLGDIELWKDLPDRFDAVVGNPPWEKLKLTRHEFLRSLGVQRHYGDRYDSTITAKRQEFLRARLSLEGYRQLLREKFLLQGNGEDDLYKLFIELSLRLVKEKDGYLSVLVPAGLIRSAGTYELRRCLYQSTRELHFTVFFNRPRFFEVDTRFKFLLLEARTGLPNRASIYLRTGTATKRNTTSETAARIQRAVLPKIRPDLTIPEVKSTEEWTLFQHVNHVGHPFDSANGWSPGIVRELDMTRDRPNFRNRYSEGTLPIIEGRMVHQYTHDAKAYESGTGRRARWLPVDPGRSCVILPQFWYPEEKLPKAIHDRVFGPRVGFCDITGQTNERSLLASAIPPGVVCGNKVPTITFEVGPRWLPWAWLAYANSFLVDWVLRRIVTTSVNYFILKSVPLPRVDDSLNENTKLANLAKRLACKAHFPGGEAEDLTGYEVAEIRAEIEWRVLGAYGLDATVLGVIFEDFPLLDRGEPPLPRERRSTITADFVTLRAVQNLGGGPVLMGRRVTASELEERVSKAISAGALPFRPSEFALKAGSRHSTFNARAGYMELMRRELIVR